MAAPRSHRAYCLLIVLLACIQHHRRAAAQHPQVVGEAKLLLQMKRGWGDPPALEAWGTAASGSHCRWLYVGCDPAGRVTSLHLAGIKITGPIPHAIGGFSSLVHLDVSDNLIDGSFPTALYGCRSLRYLNMSWNSIGGELPDDIGHGLGANLRMLDLSNNFFNGTIPASLSMLRSLRYLGLDGNYFTGAFPTAFYRCRLLRYLDLSWNDIGGWLITNSPARLVKLLCGEIG